MKIRDMLLAGIFVTMMIISAYIIVPIGPVPITIQPLVVLLAGILLGSRLSAISIMVWALLGFVGLPVFNQGQSGIVILAGPTGGFIVGFVFTAWLVGYLTEHNMEAGFGKNFLYMCLGMIVCYAFGLVGFKLSFQYFLQKPMDWSNALLLAVAPFLPFDIIKAAVAAFIGARVRKALFLAGLLDRTK
ncbi:biotin transporter BioY [Phascolarctobacterium sp.]|uniref:biotin transporter BioY n=1 Tax=Phascolarctobacterium sp. TaxID=2049039 RepID=UPI0030789293